MPEKFVIACSRFSTPRFLVRLENDGGVGFAAGPWKEPPNFWASGRCGRAAVERRASQAVRTF
jgi:hypothetical protein